MGDFIGMPIWGWLLIVAAIVLAVGVTHGWFNNVHLKEKVAQFEAGAQAFQARPGVQSIEARAANILAEYERKLDDAVLRFQKGVQGKLTATPPPTLTTPALADVFIDRDDFMKAIGTDYPQPIALDGKLVHNGLGAVQSYLTKENGQIARAPTA